MRREVIKSKRSVKKKQGKTQENIFFFPLGCIGLIGLGDLFETIKYLNKTEHSFHHYPLAKANINNIMHTRACVRVCVCVCVGKVKKGSKFQPDRLLFNDCTHTYLKMTRTRARGWVCA